MKDRMPCFQRIALALVLLLLAGCGAPTGTPAPAPTATPAPDPAAESHALVQGWVDAYHALDAEKYMSYYAADAVYIDMAMKDFGTYTRDALERAVTSTFKQEGFKVEFTSFFVSPDGRSAAAEGTYYDLDKSGKQRAMPMVVVLDIKDGKITREADYYDRTPLK